MRKKIFFLLLVTTTCLRTFGQLHVTTGTAKNVLLEEATGAWGGWCPDGQQDFIQAVQPISHTIILSWHNGDSMMVPGDPYCSSGLIVGFPQGTIDRANIGGMVAQDRPWESAVSARTAMSPNFQVDMSTSYNPVSRVMSITVTGKALASLTGHWNINAIIAEDSISSSAPGYVQSSYYDTMTISSDGFPSWYNGLGSTLPAADYSHMDVVRSVLAVGGSIWGDAAFTNPLSGATASKSYSFTLPSSYNASKVFVVGLVQRLDAIAGDSIIENAVSTKGTIIPPGTLSASADSFDVYTSDLCSTSEFYITTHSYYSGLSIQTNFGDGSTATTTVLSTMSGGYADLTHNYATSGTYTVKHVLYSGTTPLDSVSYSHSYTLCNQFPVFFYYDANSNCVMDTTEPYVYQPFLTRVDSNGVTIDSISASCGFYYNAYGNPGDVYTFTVMSTPPGLSISCPSGSITDTIGADSTIVPKLFATTCGTGSTFDLRVFASAIVGRHHFGGSIIVDNTYCAYEPATLTMDLSPLFNFVSSVPAPASVSGGTITWNIAGVSSITSTPYLVNLGAEVPGTWLTPGDTVHSAYHVSPTSGDTNPGNNDTSRVDTSRSGYDPNYMEVSPAVYIPSGTTLHYTIGFENTGNDTAFNIYIMDTLSDYVDPASIKLVATSAKMFVTKLRTATGHNILKFDFPHINLLDSSHHDLCNGLVAFTVNAKSGLPDGTAIFNHAGIFFDDNPVVMTNVVEDIIGFPNKVPTVSVNTHLYISPNPATDYLNIETDANAYSSVVITNDMGTALLKTQISSTNTRVNIMDLPAGLYYATFRGETGVQVRKFVKL